MAALTKQQPLLEGHVMAETHPTSTVVVIHSHKSSEYRIWCGLKSRCLNPNGKKWHRYGGRGITVCARWLESFENFLGDMGPRPSNRHTIERKDNDGNYEPNNCVWATNKQQSRNRSTNLRIEYRGVTRCLMDWCEILGLSYDTIKQRLAAGYSVADAFEKPFVGYEERSRNRSKAIVEPNHMLTFNGVTKCIAEWVEITGLPFPTIRNRIVRGKWSVERALTTPPTRGGRKLKVNLSALVT